MFGRMAKLGNAESPLIEQAANARGRSSDLPVSWDLGGTPCRRMWKLRDDQNDDVRGIAHYEAGHGNGMRSGGIGFGDPDTDRFGTVPDRDRPCAERLFGDVSYPARPEHAREREHSS
jgi:hypothetical protein